MPNNRTDSPFPLAGRTFRWLLTAATLSVVVASLGIVIAMLMVHGALPETLRAWTDAGQTFGAVSAIVAAAALIAIIFTFAAQQHELKGQRKELQLQGESLALSGKELRCSAETGLASYHLRLLEIAISHPELRVVWPAGLRTCHSKSTSGAFTATRSSMGCGSINARADSLTPTSALLSPIC